MKKILLTGGGTAGHVTPNIALLPALRACGCDIVYVGGERGIEKELIEGCGVPYFAVSSGKLRRYLNASLQNAKDAFKVLKGLGDALRIIREQKPDIIFSKGGFVAVPVVAAGWFSHVPVVIHESDLTPGLANRLSAPFAKAICVAFPETLAWVNRKKAVVTGAPIRAELLAGDRRAGLALCGFNEAKPVVLMMGGSSGSVRINGCLRQALPKLLRAYQVAHICGKGNLEDGPAREGYRQFEYLGEELAHVMQAADIVVSRAGANSIAEFLALKKPCLLIPLSKDASRGDQIANASSFEERGFGRALPEERMNADSLAKAVDDMYENRESYRLAMAGCAQADGVTEVVKVIKKVMGSGYTA